jgi:hypothetical protein
MGRVQVEILNFFGNSNVDSSCKTAALNTRTLQAEQTLEIEAGWDTMPGYSHMEVLILPEMSRNEEHLVSSFGTI